MKKILFVSHEYLVGGATRSLISLIKGIEAVEDCHVEVLIPSSRKKYSQAKKLFVEQNIKFKELFYRKDFHNIGAKKSLLLKIRREIWDYLIIAILCIYIKWKGYDYVCSNSIAIDIGARASFLAKVPHVYYIREFLEEDISCEFYNKKRMKNLLENSDGVVFISKAIEKKYTKLYNLKRYTQFYNGFIINDYWVDNHLLFKREKLKMAQVGTLSDGKGTLDTLNMICMLIRKGFEDIEIEFVGNGNPRYIVKVKDFILQNNLEKYVVISDYVDDIKGKLSHKDILIVNSKLEGFGRVTVEGMLAGCLVIGRNSGGTKEIIEDKKNGLLFNNEKEFINIISALPNHIDEYKRMAKRGQLWAKEKFDYKITAKNFLHFISQI